MTVDLRHGDYRDVLADIECDAVITDPPYSERTHAASSDATLARVQDGYGEARRRILYAHWTPGDAREFAGFWHHRAAGWIVILTDHILWPSYADELERLGRYVFSPLACVASGSRVRLAGDGPSNWAVWACISRPRSAPWSNWGALPGAYTVTSERKPIPGGKEYRLMRALVRDYSRPGDLVCDPCAGAATTLIAARAEGRRSIGAELDLGTYDMALRRLRGAPAVVPHQRELGL